VSAPAKAVLASDDLNAQARVLEAAGGIEVVATHPIGFSDHLKGATILIVDLDDGGADALAELVRARAAGVLPATVVGFMSHVDRELGRHAREAGCRAIARGRFWSYLPELFSAQSS
jgi:hypothetical protein